MIITGVQKISVPWNVGEQNSFSTTDINKPFAK